MRDSFVRPRPGDAGPGAGPGASPVNLVARSADRDTTFLACQRGGVWAVTKNGAFYGDYHSRDQAIRSACYGARNVEATGGEARVLAQPSDELIAHRDPAITP